MGFIAKMFKPKMPTIVMPTPPTVSPPAEMPDTDSVEVNRAKQTELRRRMQRGGRQSTIMSQGGNDAGGDSYGSSTLG